MRYKNVARYNKHDQFWDKFANYRYSFQFWVDVGIGIILGIISGVAVGLLF